MSSMLRASRHSGLLKLLKLWGLVFLLASSSPSWALGIGNVTGSPILGEPLNVIIPVYGSLDERVPDECVRSEVMIGENPLIGRVVKTKLLPPGHKSVLFRVQVSTYVRIDEPLVSISVIVGCTAPLTKQFLMFVDPPASVIQSVTISPSSTQGSAISPAPDSRDPESAKVLPSHSNTKPASRQNRPSRQPVLPPLDPTILAVQATNSPPKAPSGSTRKASAKATIESNQAAAKTSGPRLSLEAPSLDPAKGPEFANIERDADYAAQLAKLTELEQILAQIKAESEAARPSTESLQAELQDSQKKLEEERKKLQLAENELERERQRKNEQPVIVWVLGGIVIILGATLGLMLWNQRRNPGSFLNDHESRLSGLGEAPHSFLNSVQPPSALSVATHPTVNNPPKPLVTAVEISEVTESQLNAHFNPINPLHETAPDELIDLEQQTDFFMALGQEQMAIDLLNSHIQGPHSGNPRPYLKLLEILISKNDRISYEQLRLSFLRQFNGHIPNWGEPQTNGKHLEEYTEVSQTLASAWHTPATALKLLSGYLFKSNVPVDSFDLPAYRELLLLQAVAKDLLNHAEPSAANIGGVPSLESN